MALDLRRVSIGFQGGQVLALRLPDEELKALERALEGGGWVEVKGEDDEMSILERLDYVIVSKSRLSYIYDFNEA